MKLTIRKSREIVVEQNVESFEVNGFNVYIKYEQTANKSDAVHTNVLSLKCEY